ncbi:Phosphatidylinositolglycan class N-domain-containing protein [Obelidium mucronatum]|nr:Phosphatidylinositolglycan class N-domain-containing protein [Obelidium mucronatum]
MGPVDPPQPAPASRLVLFVADGLRADKLFENKLARAPFLQNIVLNEGMWGISRTHVPTESRPGHVALIAGFYEDVSAVTHGWQTNPVEFDSLFNQSRKTWSFGSPDILPMFAEGASDPNRVETFMYPPEFEDFAEEDASKLDTWVFDKVDEFFEEAKKNSTTLALLHSDRIVFFFHLLGLDTNGHGHRPYSKEYLENIQLVDRGISKFIRKFEGFYSHDKKTAYVFTADHGMSNRGNHGDGHPDNTETPLIAWGAGVAGPNKESPTVDSYSVGWGLDDFQRNDVNQADVAPLMSTLIGVPYPMNSVGELPLPYLNNTEKYKAEAAFNNAIQILRQFLVKEESKRRTELYFVPFPYLENHQSLVRGLCIEGLRYYQIYDWLFLRGMISVGYLGWILNIHQLSRRRRMKAITCPVGAIAVFLVFSGIMYMKKSHPNYYLYIAFLVYLCLISSNLSSGLLFWNITKGSLYVVALEILVYSYFSREILTPSLIVAGLVWPMPEEFRSRNFKLVWFWRVVCVCTSIFTMLPVEYGEDMFLVTFGGILIFMSGVLAAYLLPLYIPSYSSFLLIIAISILVVNDTSIRLKRKEGLPFVNQVVSWTILASCGLKKATTSCAGLVVIYLSFAPLFILLSLSYEALFYFFFSQTLLGWLLMERQLYSELKSNEPLGSDYKVLPPYIYGQRVTRSVTKAKSASESQFRTLTTDDLRTATIFLFLINVAFFGTGNIASVSSFSIESVYRFMTVFNPVIMGALLIVKILVPFFLLSAVFGVISRSIRLPAFSLFLLVLSTTDIMTLNFFFLVRDDGSWLEIGTTISHFIIASTFIVFQIILFTVGHFLVGKVLIPEVKDVKVE